LSMKETKITDGAICLELRTPHQKFTREGIWNFLDKYRSHHSGDSKIRPLFPKEALNILKKIPDDSREKLAVRGYIVQSGYVMEYLSVPPNCLYIPEFTDGKSIVSYDISITLLKKVLQKIEQEGIPLDPPGQEYRHPQRCLRETEASEVIVNQ
jgi:DNA-directed RNA polymerase V subunit 1